MAEKKDLKQNETLEQNTKTEEIKTEPAYNKKTAVSIKQTIKISSPKPNPIYNICAKNQQKFFCRLQYSKYTKKTHYTQNSTA